MHIECQCAVGKCWDPPHFRTLLAWDEPPHLLAVQPPCNRQGSSGAAGSGKGAAEVRRGAGGVLCSGLPRHGLEAQALKHPFARCIATLPLNSATPRATSFPGSTSLDSRSPEETRAPLPASSSQRPPGPPGFTGCCCSRQDRGSSFLTEKYP